MIEQHERSRPTPPPRSPPASTARRSGAPSVPAVPLADPGSDLHRLRHLLPGPQQPPGRFEGDGTGARLQQSADRRHAGAHRHRLRHRQVPDGRLVGPQQSALFHAARPAAHRAVQLRLRCHRQLSAAPRAVDPERPGAGHGLGPVRPLARPLVQRARARHGLRVLEHRAQCRRRRHRPDRRLRYIMVGLAVRILRSRRPGHPVRGLPGAASARHAAVGRTAPRRGVQERRLAGRDYPRARAWHARSSR